MGDPGAWLRRCKRGRSRLLVTRGIGWAGGAGGAADYGYGSGYGSSVGVVRGVGRMRGG